MAKNANNPSNTLVTEVMMIHKNIKNPSIFNLENLRKKRDIKNHLPDRSHLFTAETQTPNSYLQLKSLFHKTYKPKTFRLCKTTVVTKTLIAYKTFYIIA